MCQILVSLCWTLRVSTDAPSPYLTQVLRFDKGRTKNLVLALGWNWDQTTRA